MNYNILLLFLMINFNLFSAEPADIELTAITTYQKQQQIHQSQQIWTPEKGLEEIINTIDKAIDSQYPRTVGSLFSVKTEQEYFAIINTIHTKYPSIQPTNNLIEELKIKNKNFSAALDYFSQLAKKDLEAVTHNTLRLIEDPTQQQFTIQLNQLPLAIKSYVMKFARNNIHSAYTIKLHNKHSIKFGDTCPYKHLAVTYDSNGDITIWDLNTGKYKDVLINNTDITALCFHPSKHQLMVAEFKDTQPKIQLWDLDTKTIINIFACLKGFEKGFEAINCFSHYNSPYCIAVTSYRQYGFQYVYQWIIAEKESLFMGKYVSNGEKINKIEQRRYIFPIITFPIYPSSIDITKADCIELYCCKRALAHIRNADEIQKIKSSQSYQSLTPYEQELFEEDIKAKFNPKESMWATYLSAWQGK